jgi:hypothetical protein
MRAFGFALFVAVVAALAAGCGSGETKLPPPLTDEQKKAIQEEDKRVAEEEGGKPQPKGKKPGQR